MGREDGDGGGKVLGLRKDFVGEEIIDKFNIGKCV
jgi:hypothetical protein